MDGKPCCTPARLQGVAAPALATLSRGGHAPAFAWCSIPAGEFVMGTDCDEGFSADGEGPARRVSLGAFRIAATPVSNREFSAFVRATRYVTEAEQLGQSFVFYLQVPAELRATARQVSKNLPWWIAVDDACWQRPEGPGSHIRDRGDHPVVHVSWHDAKTYCEWAGVRLPTEAQWECAARGGLARARYPWGDELQPQGEPRCNIWQGNFPNAPAQGWHPGTVPVHSFDPNGFGLYNASGNVWEWCEDWFSPDYHRDTSSVDPLQARPTGMRATRGGSFLCHDSYCNRYRVAARGSNTPSSSASNCGFRVSSVPRE